MKKTYSILAGTVAIASITLIAMAQKSPNGPAPHKGRAETSLLGINLYDSGTRVISKFGSPDQIQGLNTSTTGNAGPAGGAGGGRGGPPGSAPGASAPPTAGPGGGGPPGQAGSISPMGGGVIGDPFGDESNIWRQSSAEPPGAGAGTTDSPEGGGARGGRGGGGGKGGAGSGDAGGAAGGSGTKVVYTRWIYKRKNSKYAFILDKFNRVVQIEAIGMKNRAVRTKRGVSFGSSFGTVIQKYQTPDGYEINGDNLVVRFLVRDHVAFRLNKLDPKRPHVVTGVVVAAGKT